MLIHLPVSRKGRPSERLKIRLDLRLKLLRLKQRLWQRLRPLLWQLPKKRPHLKLKQQMLRLLAEADKKAKLAAEANTCRGLPMSDLDFKRGLGGDVRRDGEEIPTCQALPGSELDFKRGVNEKVRRNGEEIPRSDTHYLQKGQQSLPRTTIVRPQL